MPWHCVACDESYAGHVGQATDHTKGNAGRGRGGLKDEHDNGADDEARCGQQGRVGWPFQTQQLPLDHLKRLLQLEQYRLEFS